MAVLAPLAIPLMIAGTGVSAAGMILQGRAASASAKAQAKVDEANARIAENNASLESEAVTRQLSSQRSGFSRLIGQQKSAVAKSGLTLSGSALDVMSDSELQNSLMEQEIQRGGFARASGYLQQSSDFRAQAAIGRAAGANARTGSYIGAGGTLISGAGQVGYMKATMK